MDGIDLEKYIERGNKKLTSGISTDIYYNFRKLSDADKERIANWLECKSNGLIIVGIMTMGWEIAKLTSNKVIKYEPHLGEFTWDFKLSKRFLNEPYVIFDDVITTFGTIRKCIMKIGRLPERVICIKNRMDIVELVG